MIGQVVYSKAGRDCGRVFVITRLEGNFAYLSDGGLRPLSHPKKKKHRHIQPTKAVWEGELPTQDKDIKKFLNDYRSLTIEVIEVIEVK